MKKLAFAAVAAIALAGPVSAQVPEGAIGALSGASVATLAPAFLAILIIAAEAANGT